MDNEAATAVERPGIDALLPINDESWWELRNRIQNTTDEDFLEWIYNQLGELELDLAHTLHVIEERWAQLKVTGHADHLQE